MPTALAVQAERAVSRALGGSCSMPLAAYAAWHGDELVLDAVLGNPQVRSAPLLRSAARGRVRSELEAEALGRQAAASLREQGAAAYLSLAG